MHLAGRTVPSPSDEPDAEIDPRAPRRTRRAGLLAACVLTAAALVLAARPGAASMDIADNGPVLDVGLFGMRITNVGVMGNAFFNKGLSYDPSFEFPRGSGHECLEHAELWIGARRADGSTSVSGGPMLELRPTLDPNDVVQRRYAGERGTRGTYDDDGDGKIDEEILDGFDDDGDGEVDEDLNFPAQQTLACRYVDDRPEAVAYAYENGERHVPLGLTVQQEAHAYALAGFQKIAALRFTITNHSNERLHDLRLGVFANLDSRDRSGGNGHLDDIVSTLDDSLTIFEGPTVLERIFLKDCYSMAGGVWPAIHDAPASSKAPWTALLGLSHTTDPLNYIVNIAFPGVREAFAAARAPRRDTAWTYTVYSNSLPPRQGGPPTLDADRYAALKGDYPQAPTDEPRDYSVLVSCGPFAYLDPGQSVMFAVAFIAGENADSLLATATAARMAWRGTRLNLLPDSTGSTVGYRVGKSGIQGHEVCLQPPPGIVFNYDPHCPEKFVRDPAYLNPPPTPNPPGTATEVTYSPDQPCIWSDLDCDICTGYDGKETHVPFYVQAPTPPQPSHRSIAGDRQVAVEWDNLPEILMDANVMPGAPWKFWGYRLYRLDTWARESLLPPATRWQQIASFGVDTTLGALPLAGVTNLGMDYDSIAYERKHYPVGRYRFVDDRVLDGFDYHYVVTSVAQRPLTISGTTRTELLESPFRASFASVVRPRIEAGLADRGGQVWVVPNPFRANAPWERQPVPGDAFTRHVDFFGLPRSLSRIRIYTLAGDFVRQLDHDGTQGNGQAAWDLISRNGQDIESGVYLFTIDWDGGHQVGKFVIIR